MKEGQSSEEEIFDNNGDSPQFEEFVDLLGDRIKLRGDDINLPQDSIREDFLFK